MKFQNLMGIGVLALGVAFTGIASAETIRWVDPVTL